MDKTISESTGATGPAGARAAQARRMQIPRSHLIGFALVAVFIVVAPQVLYPVFVMKLLCFALFACAYNLLLGFTGLLSFGHAAFFGSASYAAGYAARFWGFSAELTILFGMLVATALGLVVGYLSIKRSGIYFAMITLAFAQTVFFFALQATGITGGEDGLQNVPRNALFGLIDISRDRSLYWLVAAVFAIGFFMVYRIVNSPFGEVLKGIRDNEQRMLSLGYDVPRYKLMTFVLSAMLAGMAGATKVLVFRLASLVDVHWTMSGEVVLMTLIGGMGTVFGPLLGAAVIVTMQNYLAHIGSLVLIVQGVIFVVCVLAFREGIIGMVQRYFRTRL